MKKVLLITIAAALVSIAFSQDWPVKTLVSDKRAAGANFMQLPAFQFISNKALTGRGTYQELRLDASFIRQMMTQRPEALQIDIPVSARETIQCQLVKADLGYAKITENRDSLRLPKIKIPATYRGIVIGEQQKNNVLLTVNDDYISLIATFSDKALQITKADETDRQTYRLYNSAAVPFPTVAFDCGTKSTTASQTTNGIKLDGTISRTGAVQDKCVNVFVDCFDSLYQWQGSNTQQTINYVYELFNLVIAGYLNDTVNIQVMGINVWTTPDPYRGDTRENALADLANNYKDNFWGNICVGLDYSSNNSNRFGLAGAIGRTKGLAPGTCPAYTAAAHEFCYNDLNYGGNYVNFPTGPNTTQGQLYLVMHEMGHLLGAHHTFWCGWQLTPTTTGAIDSCGGVEGSCTLGPPPPASGSTIMSYCIVAPLFGNYNNGFGLLPGNAVRNYVSNTPCIPSCMACLIKLKERNNHHLTLLPAGQVTTTLYLKIPSLQHSPGSISRRISLSSGSSRQQPVSPKSIYATPVVAEQKHYSTLQQFSSR